MQTEWCSAARGETQRSSTCQTSKEDISISRRHRANWRSCIRLWARMDHRQQGIVPSRLQSWASLSLGRRVGGTSTIVYTLYIIYILYIHSQRRATNEDVLASSEWPVITGDSGDVRKAAFILLCSNGNAMGTVRQPMILPYYALCFDHIICICACRPGQVDCVIATNWNA